MSRVLSIAILLLVTASAYATDRLNQDPRQTPIATTGRIMRMDLKSRTLKVRGAENQPARSVPEFKASLWQRIGVKMPNVRMPGRLTINLPGRTPKVPAAKPGSEMFNPNEFLVVTTDNTVFQDGIDPLRLEDFHAGETISIHGVLSGTTLQASRIAKWD